jgi:hypothetical protein
VNPPSRAAFGISDLIFRPLKTSIAKKAAVQKHCGDFPHGGKRKAQSVFLAKPAKYALKIRA